MLEKFWRPHDLGRNQPDAFSLMSTVSPSESFLAVIWLLPEQPSSRNKFSR
jgi:hypothetical protein